MAVLPRIKPQIHTLTQRMITRMLDSDKFLASVILVSKERYCSYAALIRMFLVIIPSVWAPSSHDTWMRIRTSLQIGRPIARSSCHSSEWPMRISDFDANFGRLLLKYFTFISYLVQLLVKYICSKYEYNETYMHTQIMEAKLLIYFVYLSCHLCCTCHIPS